MNYKNAIKTLFTTAAATALIAIPAAASTGTVTADQLRVRTAPSTDSDIVGMLSWGDTVTITYDPGYNWYEIYLNDGCYYVCSDFISNGGGYSSQSYSTGYDSYTSYDSYDDYNYDYNYDDYEEDYSDSTSSDTYLGTFSMTAYCGCASCCGGYSDNITASGTYATAGRTVAMGGVPFGTKLRINGHIYTVEDRGTPYGMVDIYCASHAEASAFGLQYAEVYQVNE